MSSTIHPVDEHLPNGKLAALGLQHVLVMYAGAVAVPLIVGRALKLSPQDVAYLISADLFCCGLVTLIQSLGATQWFGIRLPVMMGVTFASVAPMVAMANANPGELGAQLIFGSIIGAGIISILIAPLVSRLLRFFPPVVTGTIIAVIGISLMRIGINWIFGNPFGPTAPSIVTPEHKQWLDAAAAAASAPGSVLPAIPKDLALLPKMPNPKYADLTGVGIAALVLVSIMLISRFAKGFLANISVLLGIVIGGVVATAMGLMNFDKVGKAAWFDVIMPFHFGMPVFEPVLILTMTLVMIVVMIESTGMFLALGEMTDKKVDQAALTRGLRTDLHQLLAKRGLGGGDGREKPFCLCGRWLDFGGLGPLAQNGCADRIAAHRGAGRRGSGDVRHGGGHWHPHPGQCGLQEQPLQRDDRCDFDRHRHDPADRPQLQTVDAAWRAPADRVGHLAGVPQRSGFEPVLQWRQR
ncbi:MAG: Uric acid transporter UacT [Pseudomonadota bacterium]